MLVLLRWDEIRDGSTLSKVFFLIRHDRCGPVGWPLPKLHSSAPRERGRVASHRRGTQEPQPDTRNGAAYCACVPLAGTHIKDTQFCTYCTVHTGSYAEPLDLTLTSRKTIVLYRADVRLKPQAASNKQPAACAVAWPAERLGQRQESPI